MLVPRAPWTFSVAPWPVDAHPTAVIRAIVVKKSDFRAAIPAIPPPSYRRATTRAGVAAELPGHHQSSFMSPAGQSERVAEVLGRSCCSRAPASDGTAQSVSEKDDVRKHTYSWRARAQPPSLTTLGRGRPWLAAWPDSAFASLTREDTPSPHTSEHAARRRECSELLGAARVPRHHAPTTRTLSGGQSAALMALGLDLYMHLRARRAPDVGV